MLRLIKMWLTAPIEETDKRGRKRRATPNKDQGRGHRKAPLSPRCWRTCICGGSFWGGNFWDISKRLKAHIVKLR